jgi:hypothetical protein
MEMLVEIDLECPACGEVFPITVDTSQGSYQTVEDCSVCCRPMEVTLRCSPGEVRDVSVRAS